MTRLYVFIQKKKDALLAKSVAKKIARNVFISTDLRK